MQQNVKSFSTEPQRRALIVGAGETGRGVAARLQANPSLGFLPLGFIEDRTDDSWDFQGLRILGSLSELATIARSLTADQVLVTKPMTSAGNLREIISVCRQQNMSVRIADGQGNHAASTAVSAIRPVEIDDLVRNGPIQTNGHELREIIRGRRVMVTGAGGSIGSELCRQLAQYEPAELALFGHGEHSIFTLSRKLGRMFPDLRTARVIGDIRNRTRLDQAFSDRRPEIVFHAAAHKHVPLMEENIEEAITNNVFGTINTVDAAISNGVSTFVLISTDKAVNPTSVMGATKRVAELIVSRAFQATGRRFMSVRFGNVVGSRGSVVSIFQEQISLGGPVTVTHPEMTRYFMTIDEATHLVLHAVLLGKGGETFVLDMGAPRKIIDLARDLIELAGLEMGRDITIQFTGALPGEKLSEEVCLNGRDYEPTQHSKIHVRSNSFETKFDGADPFDAQLRSLVESDSLGRANLLKRLQQLVPEYKPATHQSVLAHVAVHP